MVSFENKYGKILILGDVLGNIVGKAIADCYGVVGMANRNTADGLVSLIKRDNLDRGVKVTAVDDKLQIELHIVVLYGINISAICESIIHKVAYFVEDVTGFEVSKVSVFVDQMKV